MARGRWPVGQCRVCLGWGELPQYAECGACSSWRQLHPARAVCRRCGHHSHVNTDGVCRLCLQVIRADDAGWIADPTPGRPCQLALIVPGLRLPRAQPFDRPLHGRPAPADRPRSWLERLRVAGAQPVDDGRVCPAAVAGQLTLFRPRRRLTLDHARRIRDRNLPDHAAARQEVIARAAEGGYSTAWWRAVELRVRLALAVRDADGGGLLAEESLDDLPGFTDATAEILLRLGLLQRRRSIRPVAITKPRRSCGHCGSWGFRSLCAQCRSWGKHPVGACSRCGRPELPLLDGLCRACCVHVEAHGPCSLPERHVQLWLGGPLAPTLHTRAGLLGYRPHPHRAQQRRGQTPAPPPVSPHLAVLGQGALFEARRDWRCVAVGALEQLPALTPAARALLVEEFQRHARDQHWQPEVRRLAARSLRIVLAWVGGDAPIPEADIRSLPADRPGTSARRVVQFLASRHLLIPEPDRAVDPDERFVELRIRSLPAGIGAEAHRWVEVLRGEGRRAHPVTSFETIRKYLGYVYPALQAWADHATSLREITPDDVQDVLREHTPNPARSMYTALRSLFRALKRERLIFRDPTRGITLPSVKRLPAPIPADRLRGLIDRAEGPMAQLAVALVAVHGLGPLELTRLHLADLDLARGRLVVRHDTWRRTVYLDELTLTLAGAWLRERQRRWPVTDNPHLLVSQQTVVMATCPPVSRLAISLIFRRLGLAPSKLRQDRMLDEADQTADPVHLMRVFGITARTAVHYVCAAHPERRATLPR